MSPLAKESHYVKKTILLFAGLLSLSAAAQDSQSADTEQEAQTEQQVIDTELTLEELNVAENDELILGADEGGEESEEENSNSRFIPTEQISQDLGVSFPVDI
tara:strand:+ start:970 stop:1278 length:309 start_codon:yes stop_codon:yes gene_type:complete